MFEFSVLGSGSAGNAAVVRTAGAAVLVDAGLSARQLTRRLESLDVDADALDGILLTHEHGDHTRGLDVFLKGRSIPIYCNVRTAEVVRRGLRGEADWRVFESGDGFEINDLAVQSFYVPHDAVEPMGFVLRQGEAGLGVLSDIGHATTLVRNHLRGVNSLFVEANYDDVLLQNDTKRPWSTKQRISSRHGHLSNAQTAELVAEVASGSLRHVVLGHLSQDCNHPDLARQAVEQSLGKLGFDTVEIICATQNEVLDFRKVAAFPADGAVREHPSEAVRAVRAVASRVRERDSVRSRSGHRRPSEARADPWSATQESLFEF